MRPGKYKRFRTSESGNTGFRYRCVKSITYHKRAKEGDDARGDSIVDLRVSAHLNLRKERDYKLV